MVVGSREAQGLLLNQRSPDRAPRAAGAAPPASPPPGSHKPGLCPLHPSSGLTVPGLVASEPGSSLPLSSNMRHPPNAVIELECDSSLGRAAVEAAQTTCVSLHYDLA